MPFEEQEKEFARRSARALAMGGEKKLAERAAAGILNVRERIDRLVDAGTFAEVGMFAVSARPDDRERTPADGIVTGYGKIDGREAAVASFDLTVLGASSAQVNGRKVGHVRRHAAANGLPLVTLGECAGARMPDAQGAAGMGGIGLWYEFGRLRETPWATAILGPSYGFSTWFAVHSDFVVMRRGAAMAVSSPKVNAVAISETIDEQELGGWQVHAETTGLIDVAIDSDDEALAAVKRFLSYLPSHHKAPPPVATPRAPAIAPETMLELIPEARSKVYDVRKVLPAIVDADSLFILKDRFGKAAVTALARIEGQPVGIVACNPWFKGGALDADAIDKIVGFLVLCDSYNVPIVQFADTPGFLIGLEGERRRVAGKIMNYIQALEMATVPKLAVVMRKSYGQAYLNLGGGLSDEMAAWWTAEVGFVDPAVGVSVVHNLRREQDPARFDELVQGMMRDNSAYQLAGIFAAQTVIDPRATRAWLGRMLEVHRRAPAGGVGEHRMRTWPTTY